MKIRVCTYNVEWFNRLFDENDMPLTDEKSMARKAALRAVLAGVDADVVGIVEGPDHSKKRSTKTALENFAETERLRLTKAMIGFPSAGKQELAPWYDPSKVTVSHEPGGMAE